MAIPEQPTLTDPSTPPTRSDPASFAPRTDLFLAWFPTAWVNLVATMTWIRARAQEVFDWSTAAESARDSAGISQTAAAASATGAQASAAAAQAAAGLPAIVGKGGQALLNNGSNVYWSRLRGPMKIRSKDFTAIPGESYGLNSTVASFNLTLPSSPSPNTAIELFDYGGNAGLNNINVLRNGQYEPAKKNNLRQSKNMFVAPWQPGVGAFYTTTQSTDIPAPDNTIGNVTKYVANAITAVLFARQVDITLSAGQHVASVYLYVPSGQVNSFGIQSDYNDIEQSNVSSSTVFDQWVRVSAATVLEGGRTQMDLNITINGGIVPPPGFIFYSAFAQDEDDNAVTGYGDTNVDWGLGPNMTRVGNTTDPDGGNNATIYTTSVAGNAFVNQTLRSAAKTTYTVKVWGKLVSGSKPNAGSLIAFDSDLNGDELSTERTTLDFSATNLDSLWREFSLAVTTGGTLSGSLFLCTDFANGAQIAIYKPRVMSSAPTSFITCTDTLVTRAAGKALHPIMGANENSAFDLQNGRLTLEYIDEFKGWQIL